MIIANDKKRKESGLRAMTLKFKKQIEGPAQFHRASLSIVLNLAEDSAKPTAKDRRRFYRISLGSLREVQAILDIVGHIKLIKEADKLGAYLYKLCQNT